MHQTNVGGVRQRLFPNQVNARHIKISRGSLLIKIKSNRTLTKLGLFKVTVRRAAIGFSFFAIGFFLIMQIITASVEDPLSWRESIFGGLILSFFLYCLILSILSVNLYRQMHPITEQEKAFNFSFNTEMAEKNITQYRYADDLWFIYTSSLQMLVIRRDYIKELKKIKNYTQSGNLVTLRMMRFDGKKISIRAAREGALQFEKWFLHE